MNDYQIEQMEGWFQKIRMKLKGFKTIMFTIAVSLFALLETMDLTGIVSKENMPFLIVGIAIANLVLRIVSNTPVGKNT